ncbi:hypothetical protein GLE_2189 [Lysobacter enzymogenes]|uniref:Uncharacterized protein n=1 Tax=Lysobacter enzymogenes TaxID=69 RepID=A0A0S2DGB8_LYSEN|nr:hypothetical protein GLE_2189 [Lysobacter enzymogenes]
MPTLTAATQGPMKPRTAVRRPADRPGIVVSAETGDNAGTARPTAAQLKKRARKNARAEAHRPGPCVVSLRRRRPSWRLPAEGGLSRSLAARPGAANRTCQNPQRPRRAAGRARCAGSALMIRDHRRPPAAR